MMPFQTLGQDGLSSRRTAPSTQDEAPTRRRDQLVVAVAVFFSVLLACALAVLLFLGHVKKVGYCITDACIEHAKRLSATINTSRDPCVDFYAFVCGGWQKDFPAISVQDKLNEDARMDMIKELEADIWSVGRASRLYKRCLDAQQSDIYHNIFWLNTFMQAVNLDWPSRHPDATKTRPLEVMINMAANYDLNFLFRLEIATNASTGNILVFRRRYNGVTWNDRLQKPMTLVDYARLASEQLKALQLVEYVDYEPSLLQNLEKSFTEVNSHEVQGEQLWFVIGDLDPRTKSIEPGLWLKGLNSAYSNQSLSWVTDNFAVLEDPDILERIDALFRDYSEVELLIGIAWMFIQTHIWVAIGNPELMFYGNIEEKKQLACLEFVNARLALLASTNHITDLYPTHEARLEFVSFTENLKAEFNNIMKKTFWVDREIRETAARKIDKIHLNAMPSEHFFQTPQHATLYEPFPDSKQAAFMEIWLNSSKVYQRLQLSQRFHDVYKKQRTFRHQAYKYTYLLNTVDAALVALEPPLFYPGGTFAMNYASAGTLISREMVKSVDPKGTTIDDRGESIHWWGKSESAEYNRRLNCDLGKEAGQAPMSVIPAVPALEVSYSAFKAAAEHEASTAGGVEDLRLQGLENFVDKQIFFISYCYVLCGKEDDASQRRECNVPLRHSSFFVDVFKCPKGSPMNFPQKCSFFF
ncbi:neprilysin-2 [Rhipicephalus sanguineus]|uniref:neprilysin-2 n=1 Tax=Rhipicephalus sanguineus TaxID=34632 RepID=UPI0018960AA1|nr:neprilysin-2 [Rhipicephalus sanguineus]